MVDDINGSLVSIVIQVELSSRYQNIFFSSSEIFLQFHCEACWLQRTNGLKLIMERLEQRVFLVDRKKLLITLAW